MATYSKLPLSQSSYGSSITVVATGLTATGTLCHTIPISSGYIDETWLYATNSTASDLTLTMTYGGTNMTGDILFNGIVEAYAGNTLIVPGLILQGNSSYAPSIYAWGSAVSGINIFGYVNRIS